MVLLSEEPPGSDICSFSTVEDSSGSRGKRSGDGEFRILDDVAGDLEIVERAEAMFLLLFWPEKAAAIATSSERVGLMVACLECRRCVYG